MFGLEWSKRSFGEKVINKVKYDKSVIDNITRVSPLMWGEHCIECAIPECYKTCTKFDSRKDGRCKRFNNGIEKVENSYGLWRYTVKVSFREWGKLEAMLLPHTIPIAKAIKLNNIFDKTTNIAKVMPTYYALRVNYLYKEYITRKMGKKEEDLPDILLVEIINQNSLYNLIVETKTDENTLFRRNLIITTGFNRFAIPFSDLRYAEGKNNYISLYPENDALVEVFICTLDLICLSKPYCQCIKLPKIKCVVWDLDNTLWRGVLSEGDKVVLNQDAIAVVKELDSRGILNSLASKNDYNDAIQKLKEFNIDEYFLCPQISWDMKSESIKKIVDILDIGIDTMAFIDDMEFERGEINQFLPQVRTYDTKDINKFIFDEAVNVPITEASKTRRSSYIDIANRNSEQTAFKGDLESFVKSCKIFVDVNKPSSSEYDRCNELIQRTNQLNLSGERITYEEMINLFNKDNVLAHRILVKDKYGDYGLVGVAIYEINKEEKTSNLNHFVLSCRAARKLIEQSYFEQMIKQFAIIGIEKFVIKIVITDKNGLLRKSIESILSNESVVKNNNQYFITILTKEFFPKFKDLMEFIYKG